MPLIAPQVVVAVKVGVDDLAAQRRVRAARQHPRLEPVRAADQGRALVPVRQLAGRLVEQRAELMEVLQVPQVGAVRARVRERAQRLVEPGERAADVAAQRRTRRPRSQDRPSRQDVIRTTRPSRCSSGRPSRVLMTRWTGSAGAAPARCSSTAVWKPTAASEAPASGGVPGGIWAIFSSRVGPPAVTSRNVSSCSAASRSAAALTP
jgi:hypothetical protein